MDRRTVGIIATIASVFLCACPGLIACAFAAAIAVGAPFTITNSSGGTTTQTLPVWLAVALLVFSLLLILVPVVIGVVTLRMRPAASQTVVNSSFNEPIPPPS